jgi:sugar/nucleoside kinase (ribokinase family)
VKKMHLAIGTISLENLIEVEELPEKNEDVIVKSHNQIFSGAAGNIAAMLSNLGLETSLFSMVGNDNQGKSLIQEMDSYGVDTTNLFLSEEHPTSLFTCIMDQQGQRNVYLAKGASFFFNDDEIRKLLKQRWDSISIVGLRKEQYSLVISYARETKTYLNVGTLISSGQLQKDDFEFFVGPVNLFMNDSEAKRFLMSEEINFREYFNYSQTLQNVIITRGEKGSLLLTRNESYTVNKIPTTKVKNTLGCGDAFMAGWTYGDIKGYSPREKLWCGHCCSKEVAESISGRTLKRIDIKKTIVEEYC